MKKNILILMSDTGGGHRAAAEAIREAVHIRYGADAAEVRLVDVFREYTPVPWKFMPEFYPWWVNRSKTSWGAGYNLSNTPRRAEILSQTMYVTFESGLKRMLREHPADVVLCVHSVLTRPSMQAFQHFERRPPFVVVVTDLVSTHHFWHDPRVERCLVPTRPAYDRGLQAGLRPDQLRVTGLPVHPRFVLNVPDKASARQALGWDPDRPAVLLMGGGEGMGPIYKTARAIDAQNRPSQLFVLAGNNIALKEKLEAAQWNQPTTVYGFRRDMPTLMAAADILVTKAGPATITEACIAGLPMILYDAIPGQETGNIDYVVENKIGVYAPSPTAVAAEVARWLGEGPAGLARRSANAERVARPDAVFDIADELWRYANSGPVATNRRKLWVTLTTRARNRPFVTSIIGR